MLSLCSVHWALGDQWLFLLFTLKFCGLYCFFFASYFSCSGKAIVSLFEYSPNCHMVSCVDHCFRGRESWKVSIIDQLSYFSLPTPCFIRHLLIDLNNYYVGPYQDTLPECPKNSNELDSITSGYKRCMKKAEKKTYHGSNHGPHTSTRSLST